ncbi:MAG: hypothetical protein GY821_11415, partial [Gammaproteobacteria bacterium]|nr:hypothetical protein [Gammaproteobacteria bacterium]
ADGGRSTPFPIEDLGQTLPPTEAYVGQRVAPNFGRNQQVFPAHVIQTVPTLPSLAHFTGSKNSIQFSTFHKQFEAQMRVNCVPRHQWADLLPLYLSQEALEFFHNLIDTRTADGLLGYDEMVAEMSAAFQKELAPSIYRQKFYTKRWRATNQNEDVDEFVASLRQLARKAWPNQGRAQCEREIKEHLIAGLPKPLHDSVMFGGPRDLRDLLVILRGIQQHDKMMDEQNQNKQSG